MELTQEIVIFKIDKFKSFGSKKREKDLEGKTEPQNQVQQYQKASHI